MIADASSGVPTSYYDSKQFSLFLTFFFFYDLSDHRPVDGVLLRSVARFSALETPSSAGLEREQNSSRPRGYLPRLCSSTDRSTLGPVLSIFYFFFVFQSRPPSRYGRPERVHTPRLPRYAFTRERRAIVSRVLFPTGCEICGEKSAVVVVIGLPIRIMLSVERPSS